MGDYVDRGHNSIETFLLLVALKVRYPDRMILIRGNHESRQQTQVYGFYDECMRKFSNNNVWTICCEVFDVLPLGVLIDSKVLCIHGGLSPLVKYVSDLSNNERKGEIPHTGAICDILWSDPEAGNNYITMHRY